MSERAAAGAEAVFDTSVLIDLPRLAGKVPETFTISAVSLAELSAGMHTTKDAEKQAARKLLVQWLESVVTPIAFDVEAARVYGSLAVLVTAMGRKPRKRLADLQIASTAVVAGLPLYTRNEDDFKGLSAFLNVVGV